MNFKKFRKFRRNVKAISPVISVLLMIAVAVVASLVVYSWVMGYVGFQTAKTGNAIQIQSMANSTSGYLTLYVQNVGDGGVTLDANSVYVNGAHVGITSTTPAAYIAAQNTTTVVTNYSLWVSGTNSTTITVKVTTTGGTFSQVTDSFP
jgi:flagellin-like protein